MTVDIIRPVTHVEFRVESESDEAHVVGRCAIVTDVVASAALGVGIKSSLSPHTAEV